MMTESKSIEEGFSDKASPDIIERVTTDADGIPVGRENLSKVLPPHESYEGHHRWDPAFTWTEAEEKVVIRKTDLFLLSWLCVMFFGLQLDRGNIQNALTDNFIKDLGLSTNDYNNGTTIQLLCFLITEFPVQLLTKRFGFKIVLPILMVFPLFKKQIADTIFARTSVAWGMVTWTQAWITGRATFYITRALIGACEGGFIPGVILFATYFYKSRELATRLAVFWSTLNVARIISALLAAAILKMRGVQGKPGWFWLFLLEGIITVILGLISLLYLPTSPVGTKSFLYRRNWYTEREESIMINRILRDDPAKGLTALKEPATWADVKDAWSDNSMWGLYFLGLIAYIPASPVQGYLTLTLKNIGFSTFDTNMLTIPSAALQIILMLLLAKSSEYFNERTFHCLIGEFWSLPLLAALLGLPAHGRAWGRFTLTTMVAGYPYFHPVVGAWISENSFNVKKRALTAATYNVIVQVGSVISSQIYRADDSPYYYRGNKVLISICVLSIITMLAQRFWLMHLNKRKERKWEAKSVEERAEYQGLLGDREADGNKRLEFRFKY